jgi:hypothetical protein
MDNHNCYNTKSGYEVYRPVTLFFHHYPTTDILEKVKEKQTKIVDTTRIINKIKKKINNYVNKKYQQS